MKTSAPLPHIVLTALLCSALGACTVAPGRPVGYYPRATVIETYPAYYPTPYYGGTTIYYQERHDNGRHWGDDHREHREHRDRDGDHGDRNKHNGHGGNDHDGDRNHRD